MGRPPNNIDPKIQKVIDRTRIPVCDRGHEGNDARRLCTCGAGFNLLRQGPFAKLWRAGELPPGTCMPCGTGVCDGSGKRMMRTFCPCRADGCGGGIEGRACESTKVWKYLCDCGSDGCGSGLCEWTKVWKYRCNCGSDGCGNGLCPRTGRILSQCKCRRSECGGGLCDVSRVARHVCACKGDGCGASLCPTTGKPVWSCDCRRRECGAALCDNTKATRRHCKCGDASCGRGVASAILNRFFPTKRRRGGGDDFYTVSDADAEEFFGIDVNSVIEYLVATFPGSAAETRRLWSLGLLQVDHIEPCALVVERMGPFVEKGETTDALRYVNRLSNLQLMRAARNASKGDSFPRSTRDALARRAALEPSGAMTPAKFQGWVADVRLDVRGGNFEIGDPARFEKDRAPRRAAAPPKPTRDRPARAASAKRRRQG